MAPYITERDFNISDFITSFTFNFPKMFQNVCVIYITIYEVNYARTSPLPDLCDKVFLYTIWLGPVSCQ